MSRILVVDDDRALARSLQIHLSSAGHEVRTAHTLSQGWSLFSEADDDIIFLDLKLPDGDSRSLLGRILEVRPGIPVIMISGHQDMQATIEAIRMGAFDYIRKPLGGGITGHGRSWAGAPPSWSCSSRSPSCPSRG